MACLAFVIFLSLFCLFPEQLYHPNYQPSLSTINESLHSESVEVDPPGVG